MWIQSASWSFLDIAYLLCSSFTTPPHTSFESSPPSSSLTSLGLTIPSTLSVFWAQRESLMTATQTQTEQRTPRHAANCTPRMWAAVGLNGSKSSQSLMLYRTADIPPNPRHQYCSWANASSFRRAQGLIWTHGKWNNTQETNLLQQKKCPGSMGFCFVPSHHLPALQPQGELCFPLK